MNHGSDITAASSHSSEFEEERRLKPEVKFIYYHVYLSVNLYLIYNKKKMNKFIIKILDEIKSKFDWISNLKFVM